MWGFTWWEAEADNTVRENKNNTMMKGLCYMLLQKQLSVTGLLFARVGHTHSHLGTLVQIINHDLVNHMELALVTWQSKMPYMESSHELSGS